MRQHGFGEWSWETRRAEDARIHREWEALKLAPLPADLCDPSLRRGPDLLARVRARLGVTDTMPRNFQGTFNLDGHKVVVFPSGGTPMLTRKRRFFHRVFFDVNGRLVPVGRVQQALCGGSTGRAVRGPRGRFTYRER